MNKLRSTLFNIIFLTNTLFWSTIQLPLLLLPYRYAVVTGRVWARTSMFWARAIMGIRYEVKGAEHAPKGAAIIASMHQSAWETMIFFLLTPKPTYILKRELTWIPIWGLYFFGLNMIPINRGGGASTIKQMTAKSKERLADGHQIIIYPQGTRTKPEEQPSLHPGIVSVYKAGADVPVVPVTLNSGVCWPKKGAKSPGVITLEFHSAIETGLGKKELLKRLEATFYG